MMFRIFAISSALLALYSNVANAQANPQGVEILSSPESACSYTLSETQRFELIKEGFLLKDSNLIGFNLFSKLNYVYSDKIYAKHFNGEVWRMVYLGQPSIFKNYQGKVATCADAYGYSISGDDRFIKHVNLGSIEILENYTPPK